MLKLNCRAFAVGALLLMSVGCRHHKDGGDETGATTGDPSQTNGSGYSSDRNGVYSARSMHTGGVNGGMGDGSVRFVSQSIDTKTWQFTGGRNDGQVISSNE